MRILRNKRPNQRPMKVLSTVMFIIVLSAMVLTTGGCKQAEYNITGNWLINFTLDDSGAFLVAFSGTKTIGSVIWENQMSGEYTVADKQVDFVLRIYVNVSGSSATELFVYNFTGTFESEDRISGTCNASRYSNPSDMVSGTWSGDRR